MSVINKDMSIRFVKLEEQMNTMKVLMIIGFVVLLATMGYVILLLDRLN